MVYIVLAFRHFEDTYPVEYHGVMVFKDKRY